MGNVCSPISAGTWSGTGTYHAVGGIWDAGSHVFTASPVQSGTCGVPTRIDPSSLQRLLITDNSTGWSVGASFAAQTVPSPLEFSAAAINDGPLTSLQSILGVVSPGQSVLGAWTFTASYGHETGDPVYLSFDVGSGYSSDTLAIWQLNDSWTPFTVNDLTYDGNWASFTAATDFSVFSGGITGYAITGVAVAEPSTIAFLGVGALSLFAFAWRRRRQAT